jgi:hypothetical protein
MEMASVKGSRHPLDWTEDACILLCAFMFLVVVSVATLANVLTDPKTFVPPELRSACLFQPGYVLRFQSGPDSVDVVICFACGDVVFHPSAGLHEAVTITGYGLQPPPGAAKLYMIVTTILPDRKS